MDKLTRVLLLFSKLMRGEKVNKLNFCLETGCLPRTFDRDIEDIRLYLSEFFNADELLYSRQDKIYYFSGIQRQLLEMMEYLFIERMLLDTSVLRQDEMSILLKHLAANTAISQSVSRYEEKSMEVYRSPLHNKAILKIHGDLITIIRQNEVIKITYIKATSDFVEKQLLPCEIKYDLGYLYLVAIICDSDKKYPAYYRLDRIYSFSIVRKKKPSEVQQVNDYLKNYSNGLIQMYGGTYEEITLLVKANFYPYIYDKFQNVVILEGNESDLTVKITAFTDGFVKWIISQSPDAIKIIQPLKLVNRVQKLATEILQLYGGQNNGEKN